MQGGQQSAAADQSLETAQQDAWQLFAQGNTPMHTLHVASADVPRIDDGSDNFTTESSASVMLSHNLNGASDGMDLRSQKDDDKQMNR